MWNDPFLFQWALINCIPYKCFPCKYMVFDFWDKIYILKRIALIENTGQNFQFREF